MRIAFSSFGCKINQVETDAMIRTASDQGIAVVPFDDSADVYVINTCSVTGKSDYQCRQAIRAAVRRGRGARVIVTGCYAETRPDEIRSISGVSEIISNRDKSRLVESVARDILPAVGHEQTVMQPEIGKRTRTFLKIQDGCENFCSYCIIPYARGVSRSIEYAEVLRQFDAAVAAGAPEVVLSGIHVGKYGLDLEPARSLSGLLSALLNRTGKARIRLSSIEPREVSTQLIELLGNGLCRHLHVPLQSGDDSILRAMNRNYSSGYYRDMMHSLAAAVPGVALGADVIVGFPGEGDREFQNTLNLIKESPITHLHVFTYSKRPGTAASSMPDQVAEEVKKDRSKVLRELARQKNLEFRKQFVGSSMQVVIEGKSQEKCSLFNGMTDNYIRVSVSGITSEDHKKLINVVINGVSDVDTEATVLTN